MRAADQDLLARLDQLYGRAFLRRLVVMGDRASRIHGVDGGAVPEILALVRLRTGWEWDQISTAAADVRVANRS